jgi:manganese/zinc/iron transport system permease protein
MIVLTAVFWRWLKIATFDEGFAEALGIPVAAVGLRAGDRLGAGRGGRLRRGRFHHRDRDVHLSARRRAADDVDLGQQVLLSAVFAAVSAILGYVLAGYGPLWLGAADSVSAAGMIATVSGLLLGLACLFGPHRRRVGAASGLRRLIPIGGAGRPSSRRVHGSFFREQCPDILSVCVLLPPELA